MTASGRREIVRTFGALVLLLSSGCGPIIAGALLSLGKSSSRFDTTPRITGVTPPEASHGGGTTITIEGSNFAADAVVTISSAVATRVGTPAVASSTAIQVSAPRSDGTGAVDVVVTNPNGGTATKSGALTYTNEPPAARIATLTNPQSQNVVFSVTLVDPESDVVDMALEVSSSGGAFAPLVDSLILSGGTKGLASSPEGVTHRLTWDSRRTFPKQNATNVVLRATPRDRTDGKDGTPGTSNAFEVRNNTPVQIELVQPSADAFDVALSYSVTDPDGDPLELTGIFFEDLAVPGALRALTVKPGSQGVGPVVGPTIVWDSFKDLGHGNNRLVAVTVTVSDGTSTDSAKTAPFFVSNGPIADQRASNLFHRPDGIAVGDVTGDGRPDVVDCGGGSSIDQQGRIGLAVNRGQSFDAATIVLSPTIPDPLPLFFFPDPVPPDPNAKNPFMSRVSHPTECAILDVDGDGRADLVAANALNGPNSLTPVGSNLAAILAQWRDACTALGRDAGTALVASHQQTVAFSQTGSTLAFSTPTWQMAQAPIDRMAPHVLPLNTGYPYPKTPPPGDLAFDQVGWFVQDLVAAELDPLGAPGFGSTDLVILHAVARLGDAIGAVDTRGCVVIRQVDGTGKLSPTTFYLDPTDMGRFPVHCAVADIDSAVHAGFTPGTPDIIVANRGDSSLTFYFQVAAASAPGTDAPTFASCRLPMTVVVQNPKFPDEDTVGVAAADLNGDGANDFVVVGRLSKRVFVFLHDPQGPLLLVTGGLLPFRVAAVLDLPEVEGGRPAIADLSGDGRPDIVVPMLLTNEVVVFVNQGGGAFGPAVRFASSFGPFDVVAADLNGDGRSDLVSANRLGQDFSVFYQASPGTLDDRFIPVSTGVSPLVVRAGDVTGDGIDDVVVTLSGENAVNVYRTRAPPSGLALVKSYKLDPGNIPFDLHLVDATGDGPSRKDIVVATEFVPATGKGALALIQGCPLADVVRVYSGIAGPIGFSADAGDFLNGGVGIPDMVLSHNQSDALSLFKGKGNLDFENPTRVDTPATEVLVVDLDKDGVQDIVVGTGLPRIRVYYGPIDPATVNLDPNSHVDYALAGNSVSVEARDLDGDGFLDLVITGFTSATASILFQVKDPITGKSARKFVEVPITAGTHPGQVAIGDLNGDGLPDIAIPWSNENVLAVYYRNPAGITKQDAFFGPVTFPTASTPLGCAIVDVDGDGRNDVVVSCRVANALNVFLQR